MINSVDIALCQRNAVVQIKIAGKKIRSKADFYQTQYFTVEGQYSIAQAIT
ncbi:hypothetical protein YPD27_3819 [Yersinia pestis KIM D27]|nr:hypothetical protein YPD27_3819 [Yersinia pestis KIM D27]